MKKIFEFTYRTGKRLLTIKNEIVYKIILSIAIIILFCLLYLVTNPLINQIIFIMLYIVIVLFEMIIFADKILLSVKGFLRYGILHYIQLLGMAVLTLEIFESSIIVLVSFYIVAALLWFIYSMYVNNKVASIINELFSAILAIFVLVKDLIISAIPTEILNMEYESNIMENNYKYTYEQLFQLGFNLIVTPFLIINILALLLCTIKGYWIEKYNDGKDITEDMLPNNIEQKDIIDVLFNRFIHRK